jgi:uncharacterized membrane protein
MTFLDVMDRVAQLFEAIGAVVLLGGLGVSVAVAIRAWRQHHDGRAAYQLLRDTFSGVILLGLEILVAADLVRTVAVAPTLQNVAILGVIVLIRTFLSFSLEIEIEGVAPWRRVQTIGGGRPSRSSTGVDLEPPVRPRSATSETGDWNLQDPRQALEP